jgi:hypothetical protein
MILIYKDIIELNMDPLNLVNSNNFKIIKKRKSKLSMHISNILKINKKTQLKD